MPHSGTIRFPRGIQAKYASLLQVCDNAKCLNTGKYIHAEVQLEGLQSDTFLANLLVHMYGRCGSLSNAISVFETIPSKNSYSYSIMITAYAQNGHPQQAVALYHNMDKCIVPDDITNISILCACSQLGSLAEAKLVHAEMNTRAMDPDTKVYNAMIKMYADCGSIADAKKVFDEIPNKNIISWNAMISAYARSGDLTLHALKLLHEMDLEGIKADKYTFCSIIAACSSSLYIDIGSKFHQRVIELGLEIHVGVSTALVTMYSKGGRLQEAMDTFVTMKARNVISWNAMLAAYTQRGDFTKVLGLYREMDTEPDAVTYSTVLTACAGLGDLQEGKNVRSRLERSGIAHMDHVVHNSLLNFYAKCGDLEEAKRIFKLYGLKQVTAWNSLMTAYARIGHLHEAAGLYRTMCSSGVNPDGFTYATMVATLTELGAIEEGRSVHAEVVSNGFDRDEVIVKALMNMYAKCGCLEDAKLLFNEIKTKDLISWTCMVLGYAQHGEVPMALEMFMVMICQGIEPDYVTYTSVLQACSHEGLVDVARSMLVFMKDDYGIKQTLEHYHCFIDMLSRLGRLEEAKELVENMPFECEGDGVAWISLLSKCTMHNAVCEPGAAKCDIEEMSRTHPSSYVLVSSIYQSAAV